MESKTGVQLIAEERDRQITEEGWTEEHDDEHTDESMAIVAAIYALPPKLISMRTFGLLWPPSWGPSWYKPKGRIRDLVRAGALVAAEIDRIQRMEATDGE